MSETTQGLPSRTLWVRHTDKDGKSYVQEHRAWDPVLFFACLGKGAREAGGQSQVAQISEAQYVAERKR